MSGTAALEDVLGLVRPELQRMNEELAGDLRPGAEEMVPLLAHVARYRGKQLRPALVFLAGRVCGEVGPSHYAAAKVVELIHTATLVHDDILDGASVRRREPTVNELHGNEVPVLLGDYLYALAFHLAVELEDPTCARVFSAAVRVVCQGEITQCLHRGDLAWDEARYLTVIREKTASLYGAACRVGAHYAGAPPAQVEALATFGADLGVAFQIIDDCLDLTGEEGIVGKSLGSDLDLGKLTLPLIHLLAHSGTGRGRLGALLEDLRGGTAPVPAEVLAALRREFDLDRSVNYALSQAERWVERGRAALARCPAGPARDAMDSLADYVLRRSF